MSPPGLIIFDCDGVLVDSEMIAMRVLLATLAEAGLTLDATEGYARFLGRSLVNTTEILRADYGIDLSPQMLTAMREALYSRLRADLCPIGGVAACLARLDVPFCVASSSQPERVRLSLEVTGLWPHFDGRLFSATMVERGKPAPDLFLHAARTMGHDPRTCVVIEDSPAGIEAAHAAGMRVVGFVGGGHAVPAGLRARIAALAPDHVLEDMNDLPDLLVHGLR